MVHPAIIAAIVGGVVVAGVVTYYFIDEHYNREYDFVGATRRPQYHTVSDSDSSDDEDEGFNPRTILKKAGFRRRRPYRTHDSQNETIGMVERDVKHRATSKDFELKPQKPYTKNEHHYSEDEQQLEQERLRRRGNSVLGIMPLETKGRTFEAEQGEHVDNPFSDRHEVSKPAPPRNDQSSEGNTTNLSPSMPDSAASSSYVSVEESKEFTPYGSIHSTPPDQISQSPLMQPVSPRHTAESEPWRFEDSSFIEPDEEDEYQSVNNSLQLPRARGHSNTTVSSSSSWSDIEASAHQARSDISDSDISIIGKDKASHSSHSASEDEDGFVDVASHGSRSA
ncbi:hypothetical protein INT44_006353 [Umbelopsis vinacea]|uniref:Uncharacterized protein n=1 Tax=Umbelopsis vinacea TaxID=44442 RepID=A0A8H7PSK6_9FUNG|nr:hypothetical protein INT44_006353 [Umbelopsis vinacea]